MIKSKNKSTLKNFNLDALDLDLNEELIYAQPTFWRTVSYRFDELKEEASKYFRRHPLIGYSFKRIVYGLLTLIVSIAIVFFLVNFVTPDSSYLPDVSELGKMGIGTSGPKYDAFLQTRLELFGVSGNAIERLLRYFKNIIPFIPKHILVGQSVEFPDASQLSEAQIIINTVLYTGGQVDGLLKSGSQELIDAIKINASYKTVWVYLGVVKSSSMGMPGSTEVTSLFASAIPYSFGIGSVAVLFSYLIGIPLGIEAAKRKGKATDGAINGTATFLLAVPSLVIVIAIYLISILVFGHSSIFSSGSFWTRFWPVVALVILMAPTTIILTRRYVVDEMTADYTKFAYAKGLGESKVFYVHIFRNAGVRILRELPLDLAFTLFGASILTETQWNIPGMSQLIINGVNNRDSFVILGFITFASLVKIAATLVSDLFMVLMDPRVKLSGR
ncbi:MULTISPECIES: oligopeptide ABC transporter permease OppB [Mesoplasma]|uniref:ABC transporter permease n=1 Tax=Mesoplasma florum TaxID=2151 RepID=A0A2R3P6Q8_MESFO|nr:MULTISPECIES: oligopeptide ABC transporter permease OppB [Mesoplasma]AVN63467.1 ABC transporter permease [Mesoplasma florum]AVN64154.1 ABC transporter permease [Mesoplasma florum]